MHFIYDGRIVRWISDDRDERIVLGRGPEERRPTNINVFDCLRERAIRSCHRLFKRVEIYHDHIDGKYPMLFHSAEVFRTGANPKYAAVDFRMQRFDPAVEDFRK